MVYNTNFGRLVTSGRIYSEESFSFGLSIIPNFPTVNAFPAEATIEAAAAAVAAFWTGSQVSQYCALQYVKLNEIGVDGTYASNEDSHLFEYPSDLNGGGSNAVPPQIALAISLTTAKRRGLAHAGRFYLPMPSVTMGTDGRAQGAGILEFANRAAVLVNAINDIYDGDWVVGVASDVGSGAMEPVTGIRVGRVLDTIRSRRTSLSEDYQVATTGVA